jgi:predicted exporter
VWYAWGQGEKTAYGKTDATAIQPLSILKRDSLHIVPRIDIDPQDPLLVQDIQADLANLLRDQIARVFVQLPGQHPPIPVHQRDLAEVLQVGHGLGGLEAEQAAADRHARGALVLRREINEAL